MSNESDHSSIHHVVLPSGKHVEVMLGKPPSPSPEGPRKGLHVCSACDSGLVQPLSWKEAGPAHWEVTLRCPECSACATTVRSHAAVEALDAELDRGIEVLMAALGQISRANREDEIARFGAALRADLLLPEDF